MPLSGTPADADLAAGDEEQLKASWTRPSLRLSCLQAEDTTHGPPHKPRNDGRRRPWGPTAEPQEGVITWPSPRRSTEQDASALYTETGSALWLQPTDTGVQAHLLCVMCHAVYCPGQDQRGYVIAVLILVGNGLFQARIMCHKVFGKWPTPGRGRGGMPGVQYR
ncbi:hypothetical protein DPEC_G00362810 [Dallia pectoralis]|nr:hypothetical protein DPEC_G00362810 [Dallia pectoralis]